MSTRSNIIFTENDYETGDLKTDNKAITYIHGNGYIHHRLKEILAYIQEFGYPHGDLPSNSADFVRNFYEYVYIEPNMDNKTYKSYCKNYIEYIYVFSSNSIDIYDDLHQLRYIIMINSAISEDMLFKINDEKLIEMDKEFKGNRKNYKIEDVKCIPVRKLFKAEL